MHRLDLVDDAFLERQAREGDVEADARRRPEEQDPIHGCELRRTIDARLEVPGQRRDEARFPVKAGDEREVDVDRLARLTPAQDREASDEAEPPPFGLAHRLQRGGRADDLVHARAFRKARCWSTRPELGLAARGACR